MDIVRFLLTTTTTTSIHSIDFGSVFDLLQFYGQCVGLEKRVQFNRFKRWGEEIDLHYIQFVIKPYSTPLHCKLFQNKRKYFTDKIENGAVSLIHHLFGRFPVN